jgi:hypothetical protein
LPAPVVCQLLGGSSGSEFSHATGFGTEVLQNVVATARVAHMNPDSDAAAKAGSKTAHLNNERFVITCAPNRADSASSEWLISASS